MAPRVHDSETLVEHQPGAKLVGTDEFGNKYFEENTNTISGGRGKGLGLAVFSEFISRVDVFDVFDEVPSCVDLICAQADAVTPCRP
jgi:hypothetical protein